MNNKTFGILFWVIVTFLLVAIVTLFAYSWFSDSQDQVITRNKQLENY